MWAEVRTCMFTQSQVDLRIHVHAHVTRWHSYAPQRVVARAQTHAAHTYTCLKASFSAAMIHYRVREWCGALRRAEVLWLDNFKVAARIALVTSFLAAALTCIDVLFLPFDAGMRLLGIETGHFGLFTSVLGLLLTFRTGQAYSRFWEGTCAAYEVTGGLCKVASNLLAFAHHNKAREEEVGAFKQTVTRLVSLLSAMMLAQLEGRDSLNAEQAYSLLDAVSIDMHRVRALSKSVAKTEVVLQWIKTLIVDGMARGTLTIPPPILARVFHELDESMGRYQAAVRFSEVPFPFPYAATMDLMDLIMLVYTFMTPLVMMNLFPSSNYFPTPAVGLLVLRLHVERAPHCGRAGKSLRLWCE